MVEKVDIVSAPSRFSAPVTNNDAGSQKPQNGQDSKRNVDWKTLAVAGTAIAAVIGAIILIRRGNTGKAGETLTNASSHTGSAGGTKPPVDPDAELKSLFEKYKDKFMLTDKLTFDMFKDIIHSPEFATLKQMRQNVCTTDKLQCKLITDRLADVFGDAYPRSIFEDTLKNVSDEAIIKDIAENNYFLTCNNAIVDAVDSAGNPIKYRDGYSIIPSYARINPATNKLDIITSSSFKVYSDRNGRYIKMEKGFSKDNVFQYINPKEVNETTPRLITYFDKNEWFRLKENGQDVHELTMFSGMVNNDKRVVFEYNPETKQIYDAKIIDELNAETPVSDTNILSELAELFDFGKLGENDYMSTIRGILGEVLK